MLSFVIAHHAHDHGDHAHGHSGHGHHHGHGHAHAHADPGERITRAFAVALVLNLAFVAAELFYGVLASSMALVADAAHNAGDVAGLGLAWFANSLAKRRPTVSRTYGYGKATILAALANAILLVLAVGGVAWEAIGRLADPPGVQAGTVILVAALGVVVNGVSAALFVHGRDDVNVRGAFMHLAADAAVSFAVVLSGILLLYTGWNWLDPAVSLGVSVVILWGVWSLLRHSLDLALDAVPPHIDTPGVRDFLRTRSGVEDVHDLHIWAMSSTEVALTAHLVAPPEIDRTVLLHDIDHALRERFGICHCTIQIEPPDAKHSHCAAPDVA
jgi:cobalt-zinc-cadmium efflux system protein